MPTEKVIPKMSIHLKLLSTHTGLQCPFCFYDQNNYRRLKIFKSITGFFVHVKNHNLTNEEYLENKLNVQEWTKSKSTSYLKFLEEKGVLR